MTTTTPIFFTDDRGTMTAAGQGDILQRSYDNGETWHKYKLRELGGRTIGTFRLDWPLAHKTGDIRYMAYYTENGNPYVSAYEAKFTPKN
jgi:hypothetical protein